MYYHTAGLHTKFVLRLFLEIKEFQTQDMSSLEGVVWLESLSPSSHATPLWSESLTATTSPGSIKLSVCFIAKVFRAPVESYYPNLLFYFFIFIFIFF